MNALAPCLTLVGGTGMDEETRVEWYKAAWMALEGIPVDLLERGAKAALAKADHPSKIVAAIMREVGETWENRRGMNARMTRTALEIAEQVEQNRRAKLPAPTEEQEESTSEILARVWPTMSQHENGDRSGKLELNPERECRKPTRADYLALGVAAEALDAMGVE